MKKQHWLRLLCPLLCLLLCLSGCGEQSSALDRILSEKVIRVGLPPDFMPMSVETSEGVSGMSVDIALEVSKRLGAKPEFIFIGQDEALAALEDGTVDCYMGFCTDDTKVKSSILTIGMGRLCRQAAVVSESSDITQLVNLTGRTVALVSGSDAAAALDEAVVMKESLGEIIAAESEDELFELLDSGECDAALMCELRALYELRHGSTDYRIVPDVLSEYHMVIAFHNRDSALRERVTIIFGDMTDDGQMKQINERWFGQ
ncbi:MAG: amino acid ABC transporter substrate-binding protein [Ruminococcaceae bacterium]|nr:amino acid ABC transporter substrate-binding protein [Oscillospiraceae bacterium]